MAFVSQPEPFGRLIVNLDPDITSLLREVFVMDKLQCPIPVIAKEALQISPNIKQAFDQLKVRTFFSVVH